MKYLYELVDLVNNYNGNVEQERRMRNLICFLSEIDRYKNSEIYRNVIFEAAEKLRVFGYIKGVNKISLNEFSDDSIYDIKHQTIQNYYSSKVFRNNLLDKKQKDIVDAFMSLEKKRLLVSAPTSFGKTFILREILFFNMDRYKNILLVFPTIALLNENTENIKSLINGLKAEYKIVNNVYSNINNDERHIFILTPERVLKLLSDQKELKIDFFFFDEMYKIDEGFSNDEDFINTISENDSKKLINRENGNRAKAFRVTLYLLSKMVSEYYIAGPYLNLQNAKQGLKTYIEKNNITVKEIDFEPTMRIEIDAWKKNAVENHPVLGENTITLFKKGSPTTKEKILGILEYLQKVDLGQAIFYCSTPSNSMEYVRSIVDSLPDRKDEIKINRKFIQHLKQKYGMSIENVTDNSAEQWSLVKALENGYGIHHGKFPKYIQNEILKMFNRNDFDYLFCTSTIIEGVNTNAKNVIIINSSVGTNPMSAFALKNIKGRAGRYYHHFSGRVFYTDRRQREIETENELQLDFPTYNNVDLLDVDLDNAMVDDLSPANQEKKTLRDKSLNYDLLPDNVFIKNRLYGRDIQEKYLLYMLEGKNFSRFESLINNSSNIKLFLKNRMINSILESFEETEIIPNKKANVYHSVVSKYSISGTNGVIKYHLESLMKSNCDNDADRLKGVDRAYIRSFDQIRNIVEYEVPKLLCFFESIFAHAASIKGHDMTDFNLSPIIRYFELGITTEFGLSLVEYGFPVDTIRQLEAQFSKLSDMDTMEAITYLRSQHRKVTQILDEYELDLFRSAIRSFEN